jgi:hypothetical protein
MCAFAITRPPCLVLIAPFVVILSFVVCSLVPKSTVLPSDNASPLCMIIQSKIVANDHLLACNLVRVVFPPVPNGISNVQPEYVCLLILWRAYG